MKAVSIRRGTLCPPSPMAFGHIASRGAMKFDEIIRRLTGISTPIFGVSWDPPEGEIAIARRVLTFLEDRRVLYNPSELEVPQHCVESVLQIREFLTEEIAQLDAERELTKSLRAMRASCRKFLDEVQDPGERIVRYGGHPNHWASWVFNAAIGELRGVFGIHVAKIAVQNGLEVEEQLASILPVEDAE